MIAAMLFAAATAAAPVRVPVGAFDLPQEKAVTKVSVMRATFAPGQAMPRHLHPVPVVCYVESGVFLAKIGDAPEARYKAGQATIEPANVVVSYFRNVAKVPGTLTCTFLAGKGEEELSRMLPESGK